MSRKEVLVNTSTSLWRPSLGILLMLAACFCAAWNRAVQAQTGSDPLIAQLQRHAANKKTILDLLKQSPKLAITKHFAMDFKEIWRTILIDGQYEGIDKSDFLQKVAEQSDDKSRPLIKALRELVKSHRALFGASKDKELMVRHAAEPGFEPFGVHMTLSEAIARLTEGNDAEVQAYKILFETGQNTKGYVHKLECHATATEFIYAVTDIVYGVMLPSDLTFSPAQVVADPTKVRMFYVRAGEVIALHPFVLHSGSLSVEPDRSFSVIIYKKPVADAESQVVKLPEAWHRWQERIKIENQDKFFLTLEELHTAELKRNRGYIASKKPIRLPLWQ